MDTGPWVTLPVRSQVRTADPEAAHAVLSRMYVEHVPTLSGDRERFRFQSRSLQTNLLGIDQGRHTMTVDTDVPPHGSLYVTRVLGGRLRVASRSEAVAATVGDVVLIGPSTAHQVRWSNLRWAVVRLDGEALGRVATEMLDGAGEPWVRFPLCRPLSAAHLSYWQGVLDHLHRDVLGVPAIAESPLARAEAFRMLAQATLQTFPNSALQAASDPTRSGPGGVEPAVVRRAVEFIETHAGEPIGLAEITGAARVGARGLQLAFQRNRGTTPLAYLRGVRMERARADLVAADPGAGDTVAAIASRWGFTHHGHFAIDYRRRYGCSPSQTLRS